MDPPPNGGRAVPGSPPLLLAVPLVALAYWAVAILGRVLANYDVVTAVWPPAGFALAAVVTRPRLWPGVFLGVVLTVAVEGPPPVRLPIALPPAGVLGMAVGNTLEAVIGAWFLRRAGFPSCVDAARKAVALLAVPLIASPVSATVGNLVLLSVGGTTAEAFPDTWWVWWVGNALGIVCVAPFVFAITNPSSVAPPHRAWPGEVVLLVLLAAPTAAYAMFGAFPSAPRATREAWLLYPFLLWATLRFGPRAAATGTFVVGTLALVSTAWRLGPTQLSIADTVLRVQVFVGVMGATIVLLAGSVADRWRALQELATLNAGLEQEVARRTAELRAVNVLLEARNAELAAMNADLDSFASKVAHDLRAPVRAVRGFAEVLRERHDAALGPDADALLDRIVRAAARMGALIDGLLEVARLGRHALHYADVDVAALIAQAVGDVEPPDSVELRVGPLPRCRADPGLLETVFANLLQNAVKYSRGAEQPTVEVGGEQADGVVTYWVRDNGVGFDMKDVDQLFRAFSRLHGAGFEGSGVGLVIVRRIVELHGGRVSAEGVPGRGATFRIELPDAREAQK